MLIVNCELKNIWGLTWGLRWGLTWGVTWGLENIKSLIHRSLSEKTGGLGRIEIIRGFIQDKTLNIQHNLLWFDTPNEIQCNVLCNEIHNKESMIFFFKVFYFIDFYCIFAMSYWKPKGIRWDHTNISRFLYALV